MKRICLWVLILVYIVCFSAVSISEADGISENSLYIEDLKQATVEELNLAVQRIYAELESRNAGDALVEDDCIAATFLGFDELPEMCFYVELEIMNKTEQKIMLSLEDASVNNESMQLVMTGVPVSVEPGQKGKGSFIFMYQQLSIDALDEVNEVKFRIAVWDESMNPIEKTEAVSVIKQ